MSANYKLPKIQNSGAGIVDTPLAADTALATGVLTLKNEAGGDALEVKISDITGWKYDAYAAGTAHVVDVDLTAAVLVANTSYSLTVVAPYVQNFFGGGQETNAVYATRTYTVAVDATPTVAELHALFIARINADLNACFTAADGGGDIVRITAASALAGNMTVTTTASGATVADQTAWVEPVGSVDEAKLYVNADLVIGAGYNRYVIESRKFIRHNAVKGNEVVKPEVFVYLIDKDDAGSAAAVTLLTSILDGTYATTADYLGAPAF